MLCPASKKCSASAEKLVCRSLRERSCSFRNNTNKNVLLKPLVTIPRNAKGKQTPIRKNSRWYLKFSFQHCSALWKIFWSYMNNFWLLISISDFCYISYIMVVLERKFSTERYDCIVFKFSESIRVCPPSGPPLHTCFLIAFPEDCVELKLKVVRANTILPKSIVCKCCCD